MAASNISLNGIMALSDWVTGTRGKQQQAALDAQKAQTDYETQATGSMKQQSAQSKTNFDQQQDQYYENSMLKDVLTDPSSPMAMHHFATTPDANGNPVPNNPYVAKHFPPGYAPVRTMGPDGKMGIALKHYQDGSYLSQDYHGGSDDGHAFDPAKHAVPGAGEKTDAKGRKIAPDGAYFMNADTLNALGAHVFGKPETKETPFGGRTYGWDPTTGKWGLVGEGMTVSDRGATGSGSSGKQSGREYLMNSVFPKEYGLDPLNKSFPPESSEERAAVLDAYDKMVDADKSKAPDYQGIAHKALLKGQKSYRESNPYWNLPPMERMLKEQADKDKAATASAPAGRPGATKTSATEDEPQTLDDALTKADRDEQLGKSTDAAATLSKHTALVSKHLPNAQKRVMALVRNGATREQAVQQTSTEFADRLPVPIQQDMLRKRLQEFVQPKAQPKSKVAGATPEKPAAAHGGVVARIRSAEPGSGVPGTLSRPLQTARGGFRPRGY